MFITLCSKLSDDFFYALFCWLLILVFTRECWDESKFLFLTLGLYKVLPTVDSRYLEQGPRSTFSSGGAKEECVKENFFEGPGRACSWISI